MPLSEAFGAQQMLFPLCVIDITAKVAEDVHYAVTVEDIKAYEAEYGPIPDGAFLWHCVPTGIKIGRIWIN